MVAGTTAEASVVPWGISPFMSEAWAQAATPPPSACTWTAREPSSGNHPASSTDTVVPAATVTWRGAVLMGPVAPYPSTLTTEAVGPGLDRIRTMSAPEVVAPAAIHWEVRGAAQPTALSPASSPPPCPARVSAVGITPPVPVTEAGAGLIGVRDREDQVVAAATFVVLKGSTRPEGQASWTCEGWALCALPSMLVGAESIRREPEASTAAPRPAAAMAPREAIRGTFISSSTRIVRWQLR